MAQSFRCLYCGISSTVDDAVLVCPLCGAPYVAMDGRSLNALLAPGAMSRVLSVMDLRWVGLQPSVEQPQVSGDAEEMIVASWPTRNGGRGDVELDLIDAHARVVDGCHRRSNLPDSLRRHDGLGWNG